MPGFGRFWKFRPRTIVFAAMVVMNIVTISEAQEFFGQPSSDAAVRDAGTATRQPVPVDRFETLKRMVDSGGFNSAPGEPLAPRKVEIALLSPGILAPTLSVCLLCAGVLTGVRNWNQSRGANVQGIPQLQVVQTVSLGLKGALVLVRCQDSHALVACDSRGVNAIAFVPPRFETLDDEALPVNVETTESHFPQTHDKDGRHG